MALLGIAFLAVGPAIADGPQIAGTYSDLRYIEEAGDLIGRELTIFPQPGDRYSAAFQFDEGTLGEVVFVPVSVKGNQITFNIPATSGSEGTYTGTINATGFSGFYVRRGTRDKEPVRLKRKHSYWD